VVEPPDGSTSHCEFGGGGVYEELRYGGVSSHWPWRPQPPLCAPDSDTSGLPVILGLRR